MNRSRRNPTVTVHQDRGTGLYCVFRDGVDTGKFGWTPEEAARIAQSLGGEEVAAPRSAPPPPPARPARPPTPAVLLRAERKAPEVPLVPAPDQPTARFGEEPVALPAGWSRGSLWKPGRSYAAKLSIQKRGMEVAVLGAGDHWSVVVNPGQVEFELAPMPASEALWRSAQLAERWEAAGRLRD